MYHDGALPDDEYFLQGDGLYNPMNGHTTASDYHLPLEPREGSVGSVGHKAGTCRPCAHNWKPGGCSKGWDCTYCHLCNEEDFRACQQLKKKSMKGKNKKDATHSMGQVNMPMNMNDRQGYSGPNVQKDIRINSSAYLTYTGTYPEPPPPRRMMQSYGNGGTGMVQHNRPMSHGIEQTVDYQMQRRPPPPPQSSSYPVDLHVLPRSDQVQGAWLSSPPSPASMPLYRRHDGPCHDPFAGRVMYY